MAGSTSARVVAPGAAAAADDAQPVFAVGPVTVGPGNPDAVWLPALRIQRSSLSIAIYASDDGARTFRPALEGEPINLFADLLLADVALAPSGAAYAMTSPGRIQTSADRGATWVGAPRLARAWSVTIGPAPVERVFAVVIPPPVTFPDDDADEESDDPTRCDRAPPRSIFDLEGAYRLEAGTWRRVLAGPIYRVTTHPTDPAVVYAFGLDCGVHRSDDGGATFTRMGSGGPLLFPVVVHPAIPGALLGLALVGILHVSTDGGASWAARDDAPRLVSIAQPAAGAPERVLGIVRPPPAREDGDAVVEAREVVVSDDFGRTWRTLWKAGPMALVSVAIAPSAPQRVYLSNTVAVLRSDDGGTTWSAHGKPLDGHGASVTLARRTLALRRVLGGRRTAVVHVPLEVPPDADGAIAAEVRLVTRVDGRRQTAGTGSITLFGARSGTVAVKLTPVVVRAVRRAGSVAALVRIGSLDDAGQERVRWEPVTLIAGGSR
jgi:hypothetical protein